MIQVTLHSDMNMQADTTGRINDHDYVANIKAYKRAKVHS